MSHDVGEDGGRVEIVYDSDTCDEFCECVGHLVGMLGVIEDEYGKAYADEYRRQLADVIVGLRVAAPAPEAWPGLRLAADGMRRALRQPTSAALPAWRRGPRSAPSARR